MSKKREHEERKKINKKKKKKKNNMQPDKIYEGFLHEGISQDYYLFESLFLLIII